VTLSNKQKAFLRGEAHHLKPVVMVGHKGLTETLRKEVDANLTAHELIKIKFNESAADERSTFSETIAQECGAELIAVRGHVLILFKANEEKPKFKLPK
jgi:RNA-binding protein